MNNLDAVFINIDDFCHTFLPAVKISNFFRYQIKKQAFSPLS
nr:hypothetical protein [Candidatus Enterovibrio escacola]